jgi:hypothetical protein
LQSAARFKDRGLQTVQENHEILFIDICASILRIQEKLKSNLYKVCFHDFCCDVVLLSGCSVQIMYTHINERHGLMFPMIANYFCEIIMKGVCLEVNRVFCGNMPDSFHLDDFSFFTISQ